MLKYLKLLASLRVSSSAAKIRPRTGYRASYSRVKTKSHSLKRVSVFRKIFLLASLCSIVLALIALFHERIVTPKSTNSSPLQEDITAQNLAYKAFAGNHDAARILKSKSTENAAYMYGEYVLDKLRWQAASQGSVPPNPLLDNMIKKALKVSFPTEYALLVKADKDTPQTEADQLYGAMLIPLLQAASKGDPAAQGALGGEYWGEVAREYTLGFVSASIGGISMDEAAHDFRIQDRGLEFKTYKKACEKGFRLAVESATAGSPAGYSALMVYVAGGNGSNSAQMAQNFGCSGQNALGYQSNRDSVDQLLEKAASLGDIDAICAEIDGNEKENNADGAVHWIKELKDLADNGNQAAIQAVSALEKVGEIN